MLSTHGDNPPGLILVSTGTEVHLAVNAAKILSASGLSVRSNRILIMLTVT